MAKINAKGGMEPEHGHEQKQEEVFTSSHDKLFATHKLDLQQIASEEPPPYDFVLPGFLASTVGALISPGGTGKSMLALEMCIAISTGHDASNGLFDTNPVGKVCYLSGEDPKIALWHRLHPMLKVVPSTRRTMLDDRLSVIELAGLGITLSTHFSAIEKAAEGQRLVVLDTLRRLHDRDENSSTEMLGVMSAMERIAKNSGAAILFLHHTSKSAALGGQGDSQQAGRGSSILVDNARWQGFMSTMTKAEAESFGIQQEKRRYYVRYGVSKENYSPPSADIWLERSENGILIMSDIDTKEAVSEREKVKTSSKDGKDYSKHFNVGHR
jgi:RecA-family ATPase